MNCRTVDGRQKNAECTVRAEGRRQEDCMQQACRQVAFRALGPNVQRSVLAIVVQLGEAPQMLHTLVVVAVVVVAVVVVGIKLQMNSRHVISCLTASLQLSAMGHLLPGLAWFWLWFGQHLLLVQLNYVKAVRGCCNTFYGQRLGQLKSCKCSYFGFRLIVLRLSVAIGSSLSSPIPGVLLLSLDWFGKRQTNQEKVTNFFLRALSFPS